MTTAHRVAARPDPPRDSPHDSPRRRGWRSGDVVRAAALVIAMYILVRLVWFANLLFLIAFLGVLCGLAVSVGVDALARWRVPRWLGAPLIVVAWFALLFGLGAWAAPTIQRQAVELRRQFPDAVGRAESWVNAHRGGVIGILFGSLTATARVDSAAAPPAAPGGGAAPVPGTPVPAPIAAAAPSPQADSAQVAAAIRHQIGAELSGLSRYLFPFISSTIQVVAGFLIVLFLSIYIAADPGLYRRGIMQLVPHAKRARTGEILAEVGRRLRRWFVAQLIAMVTIGTVTTIVLAVLGIRAAVVLGIFSGLLEFIPTFGPIISAVPAVAMGFLDSPDKAFYVAIAYLGIHFLEGHLLIPLLMKGGVDLPPALTVLAQALMALLFGFLGLMVAVPLLAAVMVAVRMLYVEGVVDSRVALEPGGGAPA